MLSRVADCLFWMGRYVERAENIARIVEVNLQLMLDIPQRRAEELNKDWSPIASCLGEEDRFKATAGRRDRDTVAEFLVFERENPSSIINCLSYARENARVVREQTSSEMWEVLNRSYLWMISRAARQSFERNQYDFFQRIKELSYLFQGITDTSMTHGEGWEFIQLGKYLERAEKTSRILDSEFHLLSRPGEDGGQIILQWGAVLRSCSARQVYQRVYLSEVDPRKVAELFILNEEFPRSVRFCLRHVDQALRRLSGVAPWHFSNPAEKFSGRLLAELSFSAIDDIYAPGLHQAMDELQIKLNGIGDAIFHTYINHLAVLEPATPVGIQQQPAQ